MDNPAAAESSNLVDSFSSFFDEPSKEESAAPASRSDAQAEAATETPETAAERLAAEEAANANQDADADGDNK